MAFASSAITSNYGRQLRHSQQFLGHPLAGEMNGAVSPADEPYFSFSKRAEIEIRDGEDKELVLAAFVASHCSLRGGNRQSQLFIRAGWVMMRRLLLGL